MRIHIKICGLRRQSDLERAALLGADLGGFIFAQESPRRIVPEDAAKLDSRGLLRVGVVTDTNPDTLRELIYAARLDMLQLHGDQTKSCIQALALPPERIIRTLWPSRYASREALENDMERLASEVGLFLLDAGTVGGGSGQRLAPDFLAGLRSPRPWFLAGGLGPENVAEAIGICSSSSSFYGVDLNSGLEEAPGCKNAGLMQAAITGIRKAGAFAGEVSSCAAMSL